VYVPLQHLYLTVLLCCPHSETSVLQKLFHTVFVILVDFCFLFSPNIIMDLETPVRGNHRQHLLAKTLLALLSRNIALLDIADLSRGWAFVQVLHELAQRVLVALCFASDLEVLSVAVASGVQ
jgi:hypothetical protein